MDGREEGYAFMRSRLQRLIMGALTTGAVVLAAAPANAMPAAESTAAGAFRPAAADGVPDSYVVVLKPETRVDRDTTGRLASDHRGTVTRDLPLINGFATRMAPADAALLSADPAVAYVAQDLWVRGSVVQPDPPSWGLDRIDQRALPLDSSYTYTNTGAGVTAYVVDSGIRVTHQDFGGRAAVGTDLVGDGENGNDCNGHGSHVAGTVGGTTFGVAKEVRLRAVRVLDCSNVGQWSWVIAGIQWAVDNAVRPAVINMSIEGGPYEPADAAVAAAVGAGIPVVVAAGNSTSDACQTSPGRAGTALTVANAGRADERAPSSNFGTCVDLFAPGSDITSAGIASNTDTDVLTGTSMAAPHVTGAVAGLLQRSPSATPAQLATTVLNNAVTNRITDAGAGTPNRLLFTGGA
ncbi:S8 family peptidase [Jidongwangia harbinensis]|uniref:S8 family peptidase n=1 Tax=Jidongwangia harbinensis TaxID=2878561 RepID=UPI001CD9B061|nr:S8 family peptidase [Jidongwangia harbinensis]MCA2214158.1 S8 family peptidase [Jidongwangia harbinensis]